LGVTIRSGAFMPDRNRARSVSSGLTRRTRTGARPSLLKPNWAMAAGESSMAWVLSIGPRRSTRTKMVRPEVSEVTST
jgi:hypothetical protein